MVIWSRKWYIVAPLTVIILGHWSLLLQGMLLQKKKTTSDETNFLQGIQLTAVYSHQLEQCIITKTNVKLIAATFIYAMAFDFVTLILTAARLFSGSGSSRLLGLIFNDGLIYFAIAFVFRSLILPSHSS